MSGIVIRFAALCVALAVPCVHATLYAVVAGSDAQDSGGALHRLDPGYGGSQRVARFSLDGKPVVLRGIAIHPKTRIFYGITAASITNGPSSLVTFEPGSGRATRVGKLGFEASDLNFDPSGTLYAWLPAETKLARVDLGTGEARALEMSGLGSTVGGGFAIRADGTAVLSATSAAGTLDLVDLSTGAVKTGAQLRNAPFLGAILAMDFSPDGKLFAVNTSLGPPSPAALVRIDIDSGRIARAGSLPDGTTAIAFGLDDDSRRYILTIPEFFIPIATVALLVALLAAGVMGYVIGRRERPAS